MLLIRRSKVNITTSAFDKDYKLFKKRGYNLKLLQEVVAVAFPKTEYQRCIVHQVRNTLKYVSDKDKKVFANDLKTIYQAPSEKVAVENLEKVSEIWEKLYPNSMKSWKKNWDIISPIFKFSQ